ncbi:MAG: SDR family NAD(P)-dependent oxidoreductase, partial [Bryobacteraceae bacterium]
MPDHQPIAIVGLSALFPGSQGAAGFWRDIVSGRDLITDVPARRWLIEDHYDPDPQAPDKTYCKRGAFLSPVDFDPLEFGVPPNAMPATDTCQLLALVVAKWALEDLARNQSTEIDRERASVILGVTSGQELFLEVAARMRRPMWVKALRENGIPEDQAQKICADIAASSVPWQESTFPGMLGNVVAGRVANRFDLHGTNCVTDAACASSLAAISMAVDELRLGRSDVVLAGGADTFNDISMYIAFSKTPALSPTGDCRPFSDQADGTLLGEGFAMFALKRLRDAERDGNRIYATIRGVGSSSDGKAKSIYAPLPTGQARAMKRAYEDAGFGPETIGLVEAHGTGTAAGDQAELESLNTIFRPAGGNRRQWCALGSVKSQVGHTKAASGAAGLFKAALALHQKTLPPTIKVDRPNPALHLEESPFYLNTRSRPWPKPEHPRRAALSSFGFGGTNFHIVLEEYAGPAEAPPQLWSAPSELVLLSAETREGLREKCALLAGRLAQTKSELSSIGLSSQIEFAAALPERLAVVCTSLDDLSAKLRQWLASGSCTGVHYGQGEAKAGKTAFLFPGQGSQYPWMGADLAIAFPVAQAVWDDAVWLADAVFPRRTFQVDEAKGHAKRLSQTELAQPAIGAASAALYELLSQAGLAPDAVGGHSFGEITALHAAGVIDRVGMLKAARRRGELMAASSTQPAGMLSVSASADEVAARVAEWSLDVVLANHNSPNQTVLSGPESAIAEAKRRFSDQRVSCVSLPVSTAFHSPLMRPAATSFREFLSEEAFAPPRVPVYSNLDGALQPEDPNQIAARIADQIAEPVLFQKMIERMHMDGIRTFIEVGSKDVLTSLVGAILQGKDHQAVALDRAGVNGVESFWEGLGRLSALGVPLNFRALRDAHLIPIESADPVPARFTMPVDGGNIGRPYPPPRGAAALPPPNPASTKQAQVAPKSADSVRIDPPMPKPNTTPNPSSTKASPRSDKPIMAVTAVPEDERVRSYQIFQDAISAAQREWQANLTRGHEAFLATMQAAYSGQLGGDGSTLSAPRTATTAIEPEAAIAIPRVPAAPPPAVLVEEPVARLDFLSILARIVSEKTGYPVEMLDPTMALEADLGIDSIKRVEIFSALQDEVPSLPEMDPGQIGSLRTLSEIAEMLSAAIPEGASVSKPVAVLEYTPASQVNGVDVTALLTGIISEKTGYPVEMLDPSMALEADLGIDSIKRVEIFSALQDKLPDLPEMDPAQIGTLRTVADIVAALGPLSAASATPATADRDFARLLIEIISEKTGYPVDMLDLEMALEADLGIDSIKRVEIFSAMQDQMPESPEMDPARLGSLRTIRDVVIAMQETDRGGGIAAGSQVLSPAAAPVAVPPDRFVVLARPAAACGHEMLRRDEGVVVITADGSGLDEALAEELRSRGYQAVTGGEDATSARAWICLAPLREASTIDAAVAVHSEILRVAKTAAERLSTGGGVFVTVQDTGGDFANPIGLAAWSSGGAGLARTAALEWPKARVKAIDIERSGRDHRELARVIAQELLAGGPEIDVGLRANGQRCSVQSMPAAPDTKRIALPVKPFVLATGGARGVTAASLIQLAKTLAPTGGMRIALVGRTALAPEPDFLRNCADESTLRKAFVTAAGSEKTAPAKIQAEVSRILTMREIRSTIAALEAAGSDVRYLALDGRDAAELSTAMAGLGREWGPVDGVVHAAGVLADKRIADLSTEQFESVFSTKVAGLRALMEVTQDDPLRFLILFSSVAARYGNPGQAAYAMANEVLNKVACAEAHRRGDSCVVKSLNWGPWNGGMVTPALARHFADMGVSLIELAGGAQAFVDEISRDDSAVEVILGAPLPLAPREMRVRILRSSHPHLHDHQIQEV